MATSGYALGNSGDFNGQTYVSWSLASQGSNYSIVNWAYGLRFASGDGCHQVNQGQVTVNGATVYGLVATVHTFSSAHNHVGDIQFASGQFQINHDSNGNAQVSLYGQSDGSQSATPMSTASGVWDLPNIPQLPSAPGTPTVSGHTDADPTTATFSWTAPSYQGSGLDNTAVHIARNPGFNPLDLDTFLGSWQTSYNATGLSKGTTHYVRVFAHTPAGFGAPSGTLTFTTGTTLPGAPSTPTASNVAGTSADITWSAPADTGGTAITGYQVQRATNSAFSAGLVTTNLPASAASLQITGLTRTSTYWVRVLATNAVGSSAFSAAASFTTLSTVPTAPAAPSIGSTASTSASVSWTAPDNGGATITSYDVQYALNSAFSSGVATVSSTASPKTLTNLAPSTVYYVRVRAVNSNGAGAYSSSIQFRTPSGLSVGTGSAWMDANVWVGNGTAWVACAVHTGDGTAWK